MLTMGVHRLLRRAMLALESVQVELHGQYSVERLKNFNHYCETTSYTRVILVLLAVPMPCLAVIALADSIPLKDPAFGLSHSGLFWIRSAIVSFFVSFTVLEQCCHFVPRLRMTLGVVLLMTLSATLATPAAEIGMAFAIGYPVPFTIVASVPARLVVLGVWFYLRANATRRPSNVERAGPVPRRTHRTDVADRDLPSLQFCLYQPRLGRADCSLGELEDRDGDPVAAIAALMSASTTRLNALKYVQQKCSACCTSPDMCS